MAIATDQQVQTYADTRVRQRCEQIRDLVAQLQDDKAAIDDVYAALTQPEPTWVDQRTAAPHTLEGSDVLSYNTFITSLIDAITGDTQYPIIKKACVRPILG